MIFHEIVEKAWQEYDESRKIHRITDISARVSTNHVYRIKLKDKATVIAKLSFFGQHEHFVEDHTIINTLSNNLDPPFDNVLATSLMKKGRLFVHRHTDTTQDVWVVFYRPIEVKKKLPRRLETNHIEKLAGEIASFHKACTTLRHTLSPSSKTMKSDIEDLLEYAQTQEGRYEYGENTYLVTKQCIDFLAFYEGTENLNVPIIPVFTDWNIGNFSVTGHMKLASRWDYDWFRMSTRMIDFYFFSRVVSDVGDRTYFTYNIDVLGEQRFILFLKKYHEKFPLQEYEIDMLPEMYRFFLLNYVVKLGRFFFHEVYANKLQQEAFMTHLPSIKTFKTDHLKKAVFG